MESTSTGSDDSVDVNTGCITVVATGGSREDSGRVTDPDLSWESRSQGDRDGYLIPLVFHCFRSSIAECDVIQSILQGKCPRGTQVFGFQAKVLSADGGQPYEYHSILWPSSSTLSRCSECFTELWPRLIGSRWELDCTDHVVGRLRSIGWIVDVKEWIADLKDTDENSSQATKGELILHHLVRWEQKARDEGRQTQWFGALEYEGLFRGQRSLICYNSYCSSSPVKDGYGISLVPVWK